MTPKISVIVPCYNQAQYLDECLQSVLDQTYQNWECMIVNDASPDHTAEIAASWVAKDNRFKYIYKQNGGLSSARNAGIEVAKGEYFQFLDCDDIIEYKKISFQVTFMQSNIDVDICVSGYRYFEGNKNNLKIIGRNNIRPEVFLTRNDTDIKQLLKLQNPFVISAPLYRKNVIETVGKFDTILLALEDWDFNFRCALYDFKFEHIGYLPNTRTLIRMHNFSMTADQNRMNNQVVFFKNHIQLNPLYILYFGNSLPIKSKQPKISHKNFLKLFLPPIFIWLYNKCKII